NQQFPRHSISHSALADAGGNYLVRWESHFRVAFSELRKRSLLALARANYGLGGGGSLENAVPSCPTAVGAENPASKEGKRAAEQVLISTILAGEKDFFIELVRPYQRTVYATVISMIGSKEDAEDV